VPSVTFERSLLWTSTGVKQHWSRGRRLCGAGTKIQGDPGPAERPTRV